MTIKVLIADDHTIVRSGLAMLINNQEDMEVIGTAANGKEAVDMALSLQPHVIVMDLNMPIEGGMSATRRLKQAAPDIEILILSMHDDNEYVLHALQAGASGYLLKNAADLELIHAIRAAYRGEAYLYPAATRSIISNYLELSSSVDDVKVNQLSPREQEVLSFLAKGYTNKEIAEMLHVSIKTIESHRAKVMEKLNLRTRSELVKYAFKQGFIDF